MPCRELFHESENQNDSAKNQFQDLGNRKHQKKFIDETNAKFNTDYTVEFSKAWSHLKDNVNKDSIEGGGENDN